MKLFVSWSGGKDCMLALYRILKARQHTVTYLVNMCEAGGGRSRSHGVSKELIALQASALGIEIVQVESDFNLYEKKFKDVIGRLKKVGVEGGIFGDIYLQAHRDWIERVCREMDIQAIFPLWNNNTGDLLREFTDMGFKTIIVAVNADHLSASWLGREINTSFIDDILNMEGIDPCAENGEYHSFVYDGPLFIKPLMIERGKEYFKENHWFLEIL